MKEEISRHDLGAEGAVMDEQVTRRDLVKTAGLVSAGSAALALFGPSAAAAGAVTASQAFLQGYVEGEGLPPLLVQASAFSVPVVTPGGAVQDLSPPGRGYDVEFAAAVAVNNRDQTKGRNPSWCLLNFTKGALNGFPPKNGDGADAIRLEGVVVDSADETSLGVVVKLNAVSGFDIDPHHSICRINFFFGEFGPWTGFGHAVVNS